MSVDTTYSGVYNATVLSYARDMLSGYFGDYAFFRAQNSYYWLVKYEQSEELTDSEGQPFTRFTGCDVTVLQWRQHDGQSIQDDCYFWHNNSLSVDFYNPDQEVYYCSEGSAPKLQGGETYASFAVLSMCGIAFCVYLLRRIFSLIT